MPKIRGVKPDLWTDENFVELSPYARLLWIGMWNYACDNGHLQDKSKQIKMRVLPTDDVNCAELLREIEKQGQLVRSDGWITIPNLTHHQKPHKRWFVVCEKPGCEFPDGMTYGYSKPNSTVEQPLSNGEQRLANGGSTADVDGDVDGDVDLMVRGGADKPPAAKRGQQLPDAFRPTDAHVELATSVGIDLRAEWPKFVDHHRSKGSTMKDWDAALRKWIRNAPTFGGARAPSLAAVITDESQLPPVERSWMRR